MRIWSDSAEEDAVVFGECDSLRHLSFAIDYTVEPVASYRVHISPMQLLTFHLVDTVAKTAALRLAYFMTLRDLAFLRSREALILPQHLERREPGMRLSRIAIINPLRSQ